MDHVHHRLNDTGLTGLADELLLAIPGGRRLLIVVDQFEELFTQAGPVSRARFADLVRPALGGPVQMVATLRPEFLDQLLVDTDLAVLPTHPYALRPLRREALRAVIEGPAELAGIGVEESLVARLVADTDHGNVVVGVAHEAFLTGWAPLAQAIEKNVSALRAGRAVEQAATEWHDKGRSPDRLRERGQLAAALADTGTHPRAHDLVTDRVTLSPTARAFLRASIRRDRLRRGRAVTVLSVLLVLALAVAGFVISQRHTVEQQRKVALAQQVAGRALELRVTNPVLAAQLSLTAYRLDATTETRSSLLSTVANPYATESTSDVNVDVKAVAVSHDGHTLATGSNDDTARLWDIRDPRQPHLLSILLGHGNGVRSVAFSPDGRTVVTASADNSVRWWDIRDLRHPYHLGTLTGHDNFVNSVVFSPDGHTVATASNDDTAKLWETDVDSAAAQICSSTPTITPNEWEQYFPGLPYRPPCP